MRDSFICPLGSNFLCTHFLSQAISSSVNGAAIQTLAMLGSAWLGDCVQVKKGITWLRRAHKRSRWWAVFSAKSVCGVGRCISFLICLRAFWLFLAHPANTRSHFTGRLRRGCFSFGCPLWLWAPLGLRHTCALSVVAVMHQMTTGTEGRNPTRLFWTHCFDSFLLE